MAPGPVDRQGNSMQKNTKNRFGDPGAPPTKSNGDDGRTSRGTLGNGFGTMNNSYGSSIWGNGTFTTGISKTRASSRTREGSSLLSPRSEETQGKVGSGALVSTSESDDWASPWANRDAHSSSRSTSQARSTGISPVRQRSNNGLPSSQPYRDPLSFGPPPHSAAVGQLPSRSAYETNNSAFKSNRAAGSFPPSFHGNIAYPDSEVRRTAEPFADPWADATSFQSPPDDRSSIHNSDYYTGSGFQSRDGSLPPSRHGRDAASISGGEPPQRGHQSQSSFAIARHMPSLSSQTNGGAYNDRLNPQDTDLNAHLRRMSLQHHDQSVNVSKPTLNVNGTPARFSQSSQDFGSRHPSISDFPQQLPSFSGNGLDNSRSFTPNRFSNMGGTQFHDRHTQAPSVNGDYHRSHSYYSAESTPPRGYGPSGLVNGDNRMAPTHVALLDSRLRGLQQQEQNFPPNLNQMINPPYQMQYGQPFSYGPPQNLPGVNGLGPYMQMSTMQGMMPLMDAPRAPRDHDMGHGLRSALLDEYKTNPRTKAYELKDIYDHIVEFSGDQHGSRFIQQKLETANSDEKDRVFREIQSNALQLMSDVFGNYVIQKFFEHGDQTQKRILATKMKGQVYALSTQMYACRVMQKALEHVLTDQQASIVKELEPRVMDCVKDQNGNHVIQKAIERVPAEHMHVIVNAFIGNVQDLSIHPYGCRVIQRMLEHCEPHVKLSVLQEIRSCKATLVPDQYGNYVIQHAIDLGSEEDRARAYELIKGQLFAFSMHKFASNVVESVIEHASRDQLREMKTIFSGKSERGDSPLVAMIKDPYGNYVVQRFLQALDKSLDKSSLLAFVDTLRPEMVKAKRTATGKQVQAAGKIELKMHKAEADHLRGSSIPTPPSVSTNVSAATTPPPPLTGSGQSPQSSSLPSTNNSTVDDPVQSITGGKPTTVHEVGIEPQIPI